MAALADASGTVALGVECDITDDAQIERAVVPTPARLGCTDILVNNACSYVVPSFKDTPAERHNCLPFPAL